MAPNYFHVWLTALGALVCLGTSADGVEVVWQSCQWYGFWR